MASNYSKLYIITYPTFQVHESLHREDSHKRFLTFLGGLNQISVDSITFWFRKKINRAGFSQTDYANPVLVEFFFLIVDQQAAWVWSKTNIKTIV